MVIKLILLVFFILTGLTSAWAALKTQVVEYKQGMQYWKDMWFMTMFLRLNVRVLVVHEWKGLNDYAKRRADMLAKLGYVAFAADIYGKGMRQRRLQMQEPWRVNLKQTVLF